MIYAFKEVFGQIKYIFLAQLIAFSYLLVAVMIPGFPIIKLYWLSDTSIISVSKITINFFITNSSKVDRIFLLIIAFLSGVNMAMLTYYLKKRLGLQKRVGTGFLGMLAGLIGIGCASCGSIMISSVLGFTVATSFLKFLPLKGSELGIFGILLLILSIYFLARKIKNPLACKLNLRTESK